MQLGHLWPTRYLWEGRQRYEQLWPLLPLLLRARLLLLLLLLLLVDFCDSQRVQPVHRGHVTSVAQAQQVLELRQGPARAQRGLARRGARPQQARLCALPHLPPQVCTCACVRAGVHPCVIVCCGDVGTSITYMHTHTHTHTHTRTHTHFQACNVHDIPVYKQSFQFDPAEAYLCGSTFPPPGASALLLELCHSDLASTPEQIHAPTFRRCGPVFKRPFRLNRGMTVLPTSLWWAVSDISHTARDSCASCGRSRYCTEGCACIARATHHVCHAACEPCAAWLPDEQLCMITNKHWTGVCVRASVRTCIALEGMAVQPNLQAVQA